MKAQEDPMAGDPDVTRQERVIGAVVLWSGLFGIVLVITLIIWALQPGHVGRLQTNNRSDQPGVTATTRPGNQSRTTSGDAAAGNTATSGNATRWGSGPPGSGTGSPSGSSGNVSGSNPPDATSRSETTGSSTR
jgi:hypothetical protein